MPKKRKKKNLPTRNVNETKKGMLEDKIVKYIMLFAAIATLALLCHDKITVVKKERKENKEKNDSILNERKKLESDICIVRCTPKGSGGHKFQNNVYFEISSYLAGQINNLKLENTMLDIAEVDYEFKPDSIKCVLTKNEKPVLSIWGDTEPDGLSNINIIYKSKYLIGSYEIVQEDSEYYYSEKVHDFPIDTQKYVFLDFKEMEYRADFIHCFVDLCLFQKIVYSKSGIVDSIDKDKMHYLFEERLKYLESCLKKIKHKEMNNWDHIKENLTQILVSNRGLYIKEKKQPGYRQALIHLADSVATDVKHDVYLNCFCGNLLLSEIRPLYRSLKDQANFASHPLLVSATNTAIKNYKNIIPNTEIVLKGNMLNLNEEQVEYIFLSIHNLGICYFIKRDDRGASEVLNVALEFYRKSEVNNKCTEKMLSWLPILENNIDKINKRLESNNM